MHSFKGLMIGIALHGCGVLGIGLDDSLYAQTGHIVGYVRSGETEVPDAHITLEGTSIGSFSNDSGYFHIADVLAGRYRLRVSCVGYQAHIQSINVKAHQTLSVFVVLEERAIRLRDVVVTGQYAPTEMEQSIYKMKRISAERMTQRGAFTLGDVLVQELNTRITYDPVLGRNMTLQGLAGQNVKILLDGVPLIGSTADRLDLDQVMLNNIERIEMVEGPLSTQYGSNALAGTLNLISQTTPANKKLVTDVRTYYESVGQYNVNLSFGTALKKHRLRGNIGRNQFTGYSSLDEERRMNWNPKTQYISNVRYTYALRDLRIGVAGNYAYEQAISLGVPDFYSIATDRYVSSTRANTHWFASGTIGNHHYIDAIGGYQVYHQRNAKYLINLAADSKKKTQDPRDHPEVSFASWVLRGTYSPNTLAQNKVKLQLGYDLNWNSAESEQIRTRNASLFDGGIFGSILYEPFKGLHIQPAIRYVLSSQFFRNHIDFLGLGLPMISSLNLKKSWGSRAHIRASYARAFRAPSLRELYYSFQDATHSIEGNEYLIPERAHNITIAARYIVSRLKWKWELNPSFYANHVQDRIYLLNTEDGSAGDPNKINRTYRNLPSFRVQNVNIGLKSSFKDALQMGLSGGLMARSGSRSLNQRFYSYETSATLGYFIPNWQTRLMLFHKYNGPLAEFSLMGDQVVDRTLHAYHIMDLSVSKEFLAQQLTLTLGAKNLLGVTDVLQTGRGESDLAPHAGDKQLIPIAWGRSMFLNAKLNLGK